MKKEEREELLKVKLETMLAYERALWGKGILHVAGVDEVGRGPLAGPVCAACVILPQSFDVIGVDDSKKLSEKRRAALYLKIIEQAVAYGVGLIGNERIDEVNILAATKEAMLIAIADAQEMLKERISEEAKIDHLLIDAVILPEAKIPGTAVVKGDEKSVSVAAASIVAKVTRDRIMTEFDSLYPGYGFASNKGYGTVAHYKGLKAHGRTPIHRLTFL